MSAADATVADESPVDVDETFEAADRSGVVLRRPLPEWSVGSVPPLPMRIAPSFSSAPPPPPERASFAAEHPFLLLFLTAVVGSTLGLLAVVGWATLGVPFPR